MDIELLINELADKFNAKIDGFDTNLGCCEQGYMTDNLVIIKRNGIKLKKVGFDDKLGNYFYIRQLRPHVFTYPNEGVIQITADCRLVAVGKKANPYKLEFVCRETLISIGAIKPATSETLAVIKMIKSETNVLRILPEEIVFDKLPPESQTIIAIDFQLVFREAICINDNCKLKLPCNDLIVTPPPPIPPPCVCGVTFASPPFALVVGEGFVDASMSATSECDVLEYQLQRKEPGGFAFSDVGYTVPYNAGAGGNYTLNDPSIPPIGTIYRIKVIFTVASGCDPIISESVTYA